jgi:uncharacterized protein YdhG (YjbR/CyaY superfamily)
MQYVYQNKSLMDPSKKYNSVDEYLSGQPTHVKSRLEQIRKTIKKAAPEAEEVISYNMPAFKQEGALVYYAGYKGHIGFYPVSSAIRQFKDELSGYELSKGTIRLPIDKPIPVGLISKIVKFRVKENLAKVRKSGSPKARK